ncbi:exopolyphosphatase [Nocardioides sp.]|uniref:Ppx/GppA phosphatase family protein n=1 Tax=Nocardioides sp. TaxID=35761 RepID=UPI002732A482|nr:exopolyphosphatase [Nocardioides sp.]MDP3889866.1 exopolyphosphatase [Nocardioides sp.]
MTDPTPGRPPVVAGVDCGTNTLKLLIGALPDVAVRESRMVRLGQDLDRTGRISEEALERAFAAIDEYAALVTEHDVDRIRFCATSATRDADNGDVFTAAVRERLGVEPEVLTGHEEAALAFDGAVRNLRVSVERPVLVIDIGGGSTELILGSDRPDYVASPSDSDARSLARPSLDSVASMNVGSVRLHERHLHSDPPTAAEVAACVADIDAHLDACDVDPAAAGSVVGVAGTILSVVAGVLDLPAYDRDVIDQSVIDVEEIHTMVDRLVAMSHEERLALPWMHPGRADVIDAGALILSRVLRRARVRTMVASEADILDGIAWSIA